MKNILKIYRVMLRHWGYLISGLFFMLGFAFFSGISITLAIPLFDYVFADNKVEILYRDFPSFYHALSQAVIIFFQNLPDIKEIFHKETLIQLADLLKEVLIKTDPILLLWVISFSIISLVILKNFFFYGNKVLFANLHGKTIKDIRNKIFKKYLYESLNFFSQNRVGDSLVRMISDVKIISTMFIKSAFRVLQDFILLIVNTMIALLLNPRLFLISLILFPLFSLILNYLGKKIKKYSKRIQKQSSNMFSNVEEILNGIKIVKAFAREKFEFLKFDQINRKHFLYWRKANLYSSINHPLSEINSTLMGIIVLLIGGKQVLAPGSTFSYGEFITFLLAVFSMLHPLKKITEAYTEIRKAMVSLDRVYEILDRKSEIVEHPSAISKSDFTDKIEFRNVSFYYQTGRPVLHNINLTVEKGQQVAFVGSSGSGKTTIVNLVSRMYDKTDGEILIDGIPIENIRLIDLRKLFGTVTQESILFSETIAANIRYGTLKDVTDEEIKTAARIAYADEFIEKYPTQYNEVLHTRAANLSGGQKQRLCIARAVVGNPPILIFDEATSALDTEAEQKVQQAIDQATRNRTVMVIAHRLSTILSAHKIVVLDQGRIVGLGTHSELLESCDKYKILYELQFKDQTG